MMTTTGIIPVGGPMERPILFSEPMVRAILAGRKTMTRRVVKPFAADGAPIFARCPFPGTGGRLWVRETWNGTREVGVAYRATQPGMYGVPWRPSIHMPRWACRLVLEVTAVRVERLRTITPADALAEGVEHWRDSWNRQECATAFVRGVEAAAETGHAEWPVRLFYLLWQSINGKRPGCAWSDNPLVWVVEFRRVAVEP